MQQNLTEISRWLSRNDQPTKLYYIELYDGRRGESDSALGLFDLLCRPDYSDSDERTTHIIMLGELLRNVAAQHLAPLMLWAQVYSGVGLFFDNKATLHQDELDEVSMVSFVNEEPIILDFWDEWTTMASLVRCGYLKLHEKVTTYGAVNQESNCKNCYFYNEDNDSCPTWQAEDVMNRMIGCPFWTNKDSKQGEYRFVDPTTMPDEPTWKVGYEPLKARYED